MDTFAALALATDAPTPSILRRKPEPKSAPLITVTMWKMIIGQSIYQLVVTLILYFGGKTILSYQTVHEQHNLQTTIFNTFVWMQIFNQYNCRRLDNNFNIFEGMFRNYWFLGIQLIIVGGQLLIIFVGGQAFSVYRLNAAQWAYSIVLGFLSMPIAVTIRLIPDELFAKVMPSLPSRRRQEGPAVFVQDEDERVQQWNPALEDIREELTFLKKLRGGRMSELAYKLQHPREMLPRSRSASRSRSRSNSDLPKTPDVDSGGQNSQQTPSSPSPQQTPERAPRRRARTSSSVFGPAAAMAGIIAGSVAGGWSPIERRSGEQEPLRFSRSSPFGGLNDMMGVEVHPDTRADDPVIVEYPPQSPIPPSQNPELTPSFDFGPNSPSQGTGSNRRRASHSHHSSKNG